jgi:hypothetical protein
LNQAAFTVWFHDVADSKLSQSALPSEKRELLPEELLLELDESLHSDGVATVSVLGERSASAMSLRARMSSIVVQDFSGGMLAPLAVASVVASAVARGSTRAGGALRARAPWRAPRGCKRIHPGATTRGMLIS